MPAPRPTAPLQQLDGRHLAELTDFLAQDPVAHLHLLSLLDRGDLEDAPSGSWTGIRHHGGHLRAVLYIRRSTAGSAVMSAVPVGEPAACTILGQRLRRRGGARMVVGDRAACDALWLGMGRPWFRVSYDQRLYVCREVSDGPRLPAEPAQPTDVVDLAPMHARMLEEDLQVPRNQIDPLAQMAQLNRMITQGRMFVSRADDADQPLRFCIDIGTPSRRGTQVGGTFVPERFRGQGIATRAMRSICDHLLGTCQVPYVTLHVHERNRPAVRCYERAGFRASVAYRLMVR